jgi:hypothetical protein
MKGIPIELFELRVEVSQAAIEAMQLLPGSLFIAMRSASCGAC